MKYIAIIAIALTIAGCSAFSTTDAIDVASRILFNKGSVKVQQGDTLRIIHSYPTTICKLKVRRDSTYTLLSGDRLHVAWRDDSSAIIVAEIVPDTFSIRK